MAPNGGFSDGSPNNNPIISGLDDHVVNILHQMGTKTDQDILADLCGLEMSDLSDVREYLFNSSLDIVRQRINDHGIPVGKINIALRKRIINKTFAEDILKLVFYVIGKDTVFPRDVLSMSGQYVDLNNSNCTESEDNKDNGLYKKLVDCISDLTNKYDTLDIQQKQLRKDCANLEQLHGQEIQQIKDHIKNNNNSAIQKPSPAVNPNLALTTASSTDTQQTSAEQITPGQQQQTITQANGSTHGSNSGQRPGAGETGTQSPDRGSVGGPGAVSESFTGHSTPEISDLLSNVYNTQPQPPIKNEQSRQKPVFRDPKKRLIDSSTSPSLVKMQEHTNIKHTDSGDICDTDNSDDGFSLVDRSKRKRKHNDGLISGIKRETGVRVYVQNLHRKPGQPLREISDNVKKYCTSKGVRPMNAFTIRNRVTDDMVGCQLTIPMRFYDTVIADRFWPSEIECKKWEDKPDKGTTGQLNHNPPRSETESISGRSRSRSRNSLSSNKSNRNHSRSISRGSRSRSWNRNYAGGNMSAWNKPRQ